MRLTQALFLIFVFGSLSCATQPLAPKIPASPTLIKLSSTGDFPGVKNFLTVDAAAIDGQTELGFTALMMAAFKGHADIVALLLKMGANPSLRDRDGLTALHLAAQRKVPEVIEELLKSKPQLNDKDNFGFTPLSYAARFSNVDSLDRLLKAGANPNITDQQNWNALFLTIVRGSWEHFERLKNLVNLKVQDDEGDTVLHLAVEFNRNEMIQALLKPPLLNIRNKLGETPLLVASRTSPVETIQWLVAAGSQISVADVKGRTPLLNAARMKNMKAVEYLLKSGADPLAQDFEKMDLTEVLLRQDMSPDWVDNFIRTSSASAGK